MKRTVCSLIVAAAVSGISLTANAENSWKEKSKDAWIDGKAETTLLFSGHLNSFDINTDVVDGNITLTGKVESEVDKALAEELVANLDGVEGVDNQLSVVNDETMSDSDTLQTLTDAKVETVVKTRLLFESEVAGTDIEVEVDKGTVTLTGEVESDAEKELAEAIAKNTSDVENVVNKLEIINS